MRLKSFDKLSYCMSLENLGTLVLNSAGFTNNVVEISFDKGNFSTVLQNTDLL